MATLAFCVAIGGTGYAASKIDGGQIKAGTIKGKALKKRTIPGAKVKPDALTGSQVKEATLGQVPAAARAQSAASAENSSRLGGLTAAQLTDACPPATRPYAGACIEEATRLPRPWRGAAEACGDAGRRLPALDELVGFRREPGITLASPEHVSLLFDSDGNPVNSDGFWTVALYDNGAISTGFEYGTEGSARFRCVAPMTNR